MLLLSFSRTFSSSLCSTKTFVSRRVHFAYAIPSLPRDNASIRHSSLPATRRTWNRCRPSRRKSSPNNAKTQSFDGTGLTRATYLHTVAIVCGPQNPSIRGRVVPWFTSVLGAGNNLQARAFSLFQASQQHGLNDKSKGKMCSALVKYGNAQDRLPRGLESNLLKANTSGE